MRNKKVVAILLVLAMVLPLAADLVSAEGNNSIVEIKDEKFKELINRNLNKKDLEADITMEEMLSLETLDGKLLEHIDLPEEEKDAKQGPMFRGIKDITGIKYAKNLKKIILKENLIKDISELAELEELEYLDIHRNRVVDLSPLSNLKKLTYLDIYNNEVSDLGPLESVDTIEYFDCHFNCQVEGKKIENIKGLRNKPNMYYCNIESNAIEDISELADMPKLTNVGVGGNRIKDLRPLKKNIDEYFLKGYFIEGAPADNPNLYTGMNFQSDYDEHLYNIGRGNKLVLDIPVRGLDDFVAYALKEFEAELPAVMGLPEEVEAKVQNGKLIMTFPESQEEVKTYDLSNFNLEYEVYNLTFKNFKVVQGGKLEFKDLEDLTWAKEAVLRQAEKGIIKGYEDKSIRPMSEITRAEFLAMVNRAFDFDFEAGNDFNFKDVNKKDWFFEDLKKLSSLSIVNGYEDNSFRPNKNITREEMATILIRAIEKSEGKTIEVKDRKDFKDKDKLSSWAKDSMDKALELELIKGFENNTIRPKSNARRAEVCLILDRYMNK